MQRSIQHYKRNSKRCLEASWSTYAKMYDLPEDMLGARFSYGGKLIEIVGFLPTRPKNDIEFKNISTGKCYIAPHATVKRAYELAMKRKVAVGV